MSHSGKIVTRSPQALCQRSKILVTPPTHKALDLDRLLGVIKLVVVSITTKAFDRDCPFVDVVFYCVDHHLM
jgi:hypothetical protein